MKLPFVKYAFKVQEMVTHEKRATLDISMLSLTYWQVQLKAEGNIFTLVNQGVGLILIQLLPTQVITIHGERECLNKMSKQTYKFMVELAERSLEFILKGAFLLCMRFAITLLNSFFKTWKCEALVRDWRTKWHTGVAVAAFSPSERAELIV